MTPNYEQVLSLAQELPASDRLRLISELANLLAQSESSGEENGTARAPETLEQQDDEAWWAAFFAKIDATPDDESLPADLSTNPKYMEGYGEDGPTPENVIVDTEGIRGRCLSGANERIAERLPDLHHRFGLQYLSPAR